MKKLLAMALALATITSFAIVGANAASPFRDQAAIKQTEAVEVLNACGILIGDQNGNFNPDGKLDRASAAKILAYLDIGEKSAEEMPAESVFEDVPASHWAAKYIGYCYQAGYINGDGQGHFFPDQELDQYSFGKMLETILGYDAEIEGLVGDQWKLKIAALASKIGLTENLNKAGSEPLTREEGARMALNALKANTVDYANKGTEIRVGDGTTVSVGASQAEPVHSTESYSTAIDADEVGGDDQGKILQLGEKLFKGDLKKQEINDELGRLADRWSWKVTVIGTYTTSPDHVVVTDKSKSLADVIGDINTRYRVNSTMTTVFLNGVAWDDIYGNNPVPTFDEFYRASYTNAAAATQNRVNNLSKTRAGTVIQVTMWDEEPNTVKNIAVIRYNSVKTTGDVATKGDPDSLEVRVPGLTSGYVKQERIRGFENIVKDVVIYYAEGNTKQDGSGDATYEIYRPQRVEGQMTRAKTSTEDPTKYTINGTQYQVNMDVVALNTNPDAAQTAQEARPSKVFDGMGSESNFNTLYAYYFDANGYIVYAEQIEASNYDFVLISQLRMPSDVWDGNSVEARLVHLDGTTEIRTVKSIEVVTNYNANTERYTTRTYSDEVDDQPLIVSGAINAELLNLQGNWDTTAQQAQDKVNVPGAYTTSPYQSGVRLFTYSINSDGEVELTDAWDENDITLEFPSNDALSATVYTDTSRMNPRNGRMDGIGVDDNTVFVVLKNTTDATPKFLSFTGMKNAPKFAGPVKYIAAVKGSVATSVFVYDYGSKTDSGNKILVLSSENVGKTKIGNDSNIYMWTVYRDGEVVDIPVTNAMNTRLTTYGGVVEITPTYNDDGVLDDFETSDGNIRLGGADNFVRATSKDNMTAGKATQKISSVTHNFTDYGYGYRVNGGTLSIARTFNQDGEDTYNAFFSAPSSATVIYMDTDDNYSIGTIADLNRDDNDQVYVICDGDDADTVKMVFIRERASDNNKVANIYTVQGSDAYDYAHDGSYTYTVENDTNWYLVIETEAGSDVRWAGHTSLTANGAGNSGVSAIYRVNSSSGSITFDVLAEDAKEYKTYTLNYSN